MDMEVYEEILFDHLILRWSARILGTIVVAPLIYPPFLNRSRISKTPGQTALFFRVSAITW
jgi:hypothetical protein